MSNIPNSTRHFPEGMRRFPKGMDNIPNSIRHFLVGAKDISYVHCVGQCDVRCFSVGAYCNTPVHYVKRL
ncbi:hypothetical protein [Capnocytophaga canimorsus]|uniref:hypothetical protein n=1 Tax=Capnocytophaga canimorsus TaxID=28188 RepID=UPI0037CE6DE8